MQDVSNQLSRKLNGRSSDLDLQCSIITLLQSRALAGETNSIPEQDFQLLQYVRDIISMEKGLEIGPAESVMASQVRST